MPKRPFRVFLASVSPLGTATSTTTPRGLLAALNAAATCWVIIWRGTGLMAGPPTSRPRPGRVTVPTPTPPRSSMSGWWFHRTVAWISAPWVTSGSSPASLITPQRQTPSLSSQRARLKVTSWPAGNRMVTSRSGWPVSRGACCRGSRGRGARPGGVAGTEAAPLDALEVFLVTGVGLCRDVCPWRRRSFRVS